MQVNPYISRKPYNVIYKDLHTGELQKVSRRPAAKLHTMLPTDVVELRYKKNDDWQPGEEHTVKHINPRQPNTLQVENEQGETTFVDSSMLALKEEVANRGKPAIDDAKENQYLLWP